MSTFKNKNSLRTTEAQIVQKLKNNEARPKFTGSYKKKRVLTVDYDNLFRNSYISPLTTVCKIDVLHVSPASKSMYFYKKSFL